MSDDLVIRRERPEDETAIAQLIGEAFAGAQHSDGKEAEIVQKLRASGMLTLSLVAELECIVGHVAFSPVEIDGCDVGWFGLAPVAVLPRLHGNGIGSDLINEGLRYLREMGAAGCVVLGEPGYYARFGFSHDPELIYPGPPPEYFQRMALNGNPERGEVRYAPAFG